MGGKEKEGLHFSHDPTSLLGTTLHTRPAVSASLAVIVPPVSMSSIAYGKNEKERINNEIYCKEKELKMV